MKNFLTTIIIGAALLHGICHADPLAPSPASPSSGNSANAASSSRNSQTSASPATPQTPNNHSGPGQTQTGNSSVNSLSANPPSDSVNPSPQAVSTKVSIPKMVLPENKTTGLNSSKARPSTVIQPAGPLFRDARNRGPVTGVLGGPAKSKTTAVISGATVHRKP